MKYSLLSVRHSCLWILQPSVDSDLTDSACVGFVIMLYYNLVKLHIISVATSLASLLHTQSLAFLCFKLQTAVKLLPALDVQPSDQTNTELRVFIYL